MTVHGNNGTRPIKILIAGMGGEGGGMLTSWIVNASRARQFSVQATSVPGVAQRSGATTYYIEILATRKTDLNKRPPVFDMYPRPGDIDLVIATELLEAGRMIERGYVSPGKTTLIASTHRVYSLAEKMEMGDGRYDGGAILKAAGDMARDAYLFDMERAASNVGSAINAVLLGTIAVAEVLPIDVDTFKHSIAQQGNAVESNLAGFMAGCTIIEQSGAPTTRPTPVETRHDGKTTETLRVRIERDFAAEVRPVVYSAADRCLDFLNPAYAELFLDRLDSIRRLPGVGADLVRETARHLGLRMAYEDVFRVAQLKSRTARFTRIQREVRATPEQHVRITEFLKPGPEELAQVLPRFIGRPIVQWARANPTKARALHMPMRIRTDTIFGLLCLRAIASLRGLRRIGEQYTEEQQFIEHWLDLIRQTVGIDLSMAREVVECAGLIKGYSDTRSSSMGSFRRITEVLIEPVIDGAAFTSSDLARAREAAMTDPEGMALSVALSKISNPAHHQDME